MIRSSLFVLFFMTLASVSAQQISTNLSKVEFTISNLGVNKVNGTIGGMTGSFMLDDQNLSGSFIDIAIDPATIDTGIKKRDEHLQTEDYFEVANYSEIKFSSNDIKKSGSGFIASGELTMHGVTKKMNIPVAYVSENGKRTLKAEFSIDRTDFGVGPKGGFTVGKEVEIHVTCVYSE